MVVGFVLEGTRFKLVGGSSASNDIFIGGSDDGFYFGSSTSFVASMAHLSKVSSLTNLSPFVVQSIGLDDKIEML